MKRLYEEKTQLIPDTIILIFHVRMSRVLIMIDPEKKLWQRVILTAVEDALAPINNHNKKSLYQIKIINDARNWILNNNRDYFRVCHMADIDPLSLRTKVREILADKNHDKK